MVRISCVIQICRENYGECLDVGGDCGSTKESSNNWLISLSFLEGAAHVLQNKFGSIQKLQNAKLLNINIP